MRRIAIEVVVFVGGTDVKAGRFVDVFGEGVDFEPDRVEAGLESGEGVTSVFVRSRSVEEAFGEAVLVLVEVKLEADIGLGLFVFVLEAIAIGIEPNEVADRGGLREGAEEKGKKNADHGGRSSYGQREAFINRADGNGSFCESHQNLQRVWALLEGGMPVCHGGSF